jgi:hypothetical protein
MEDTMKHESCLYKHTYRKINADLTRAKPARRMLECHLFEIPPKSIDIEERTDTKPNLAVN